MSAMLMKAARMD